jgi:pimeloyl-ACP methyl ester carboxylesterase
MEMGGLSAAVAPRTKLRRTRIAATGLGLCALCIGAGSLWNGVAEKQWSRQHPPPGDLYTVEGKQMHIDCTGTGSPTLVMESAASARWTQWRKVQPALSQVTRVCSYDRAGHGWSEPRSGPRDAETIVHELHFLLDQAGVTGPFIYASESAGGLYVREYAREFPDEVAGVALIDSSSPQQIDELPGFRASYEEQKRQARRTLWKDRLLVWSGWERLLGHCASRTDTTDCRPSYVDMDEDELPYFEESSQQAGRLQNFGNIPLLVITRDTNPKNSGIANDVAQDSVWEREQEGSKALSPLSWRVIARGSGHIVPVDRPDVVILEMTRMIGYLRGGLAPAFGTTIMR